MASPVLAPQIDTRKDKNKTGPLIIAFSAAIAGAVIFGGWQTWRSLAMSVSLQNLTSLLAPIAFAAAVVERGVEILISPWRDAAANKLENEIAAIKARTPANTPMPQDDQDKLRKKSDELDEYRGETQRYAFLASMVLSTLVSIAGVRALGPFLSTSAFATSGTAQERFFLFVDVTLTATLLAGGADGVHSIVNAVTTFFQSTADKASKS